MAKFKKAFNANKVILITAVIILSFRGAVYSFPDFQNNLRLEVGKGETLERLKARYREILTDRIMNIIEDMDKRWRGYQEAIDRSRNELYHSAFILSYYISKEIGLNEIDKTDRFMMHNMLGKIRNVLSIFDREDVELNLRKNPLISKTILDLQRVSKWEELPPATREIENAPPGHVKKVLDYYIADLRTLSAVLERDIAIIDNMARMENRDLTRVVTRYETKKETASFARHRFKNFRQIMSSSFHHIIRFGEEFDKEGYKSLILSCNTLKEDIAKIISEKDFLYEDPSYIEKLYSEIAGFIQRIESEDRIGVFLSKHRGDDKAIDETEKNFNNVVKRMKNLLELLSIDTNDITEIMIAFKEKAGEIDEKDHLARCDWAGLSSEPLLFERIDKDDSANIVFSVDELIENADKAGKGKEEIQVRTSKKDKMINIEVSDNGPGIPIEERGRRILEHIFDEYFTTREEGTGGEGLHIIKMFVVDLKNGAIKVSTKTDNDIAHILIIDSSGARLEEIPDRKDTGTTITLSIPEFSIGKAPDLETIRPQVDI